MLDELAVRNLAVIEEARIEPGPGLTVVTGETGAGKTLLVGALRLLLGRAADSDLVGPFGDEAEVEGRLLRPDGTEVAAARRLSRTGRSRAYLDGGFASAAALDRATDGLVEVIGQHDHITLTRPAVVRAMIDAGLDEEGVLAREAYREAWARLRELEEDQRRLGGDRQSIARELDLLSYQAEEITRAGFAPGEDTDLEARLGRLRNVEQLRELLASGRQEAVVARDAAGSAVAALRRAAALDSGLSKVLGEMEMLEQQLGEAAVDLGVVAEDLDADPSSLQGAEERMTALADLRRKYGPELEDVLRFGDEARIRAGALRDLLERADLLDDDIAAGRRELESAGSSLRAARVAAGSRLVEAALTHLRELGFSSPRLVVDVVPGATGTSGADDIKLLFASDDRLPPGEISRTASGGELSRLVLSLRLGAGTGDASTLLFDEIDAGVGGATALALGRKLAFLARTRQVLCVTHLPQLAAVAGTHYVVSREELRATVAKVEGSERVAELSRMLAGLPDSERGKQAAEELLELAGRW